MPPRKKSAEEVAAEARMAYLASAERARRIFDAEEAEVARGGPRHPDEGKGINKKVGIRVIGGLAVAWSLYLIWNKEQHQARTDRKRFE
jgi:hypothetical protein